MRDSLSGQADLAIRGASIATMDGEDHVFDEGHIIIKDGRIVAVGCGEPQGWSAKDVISATGMVALPGLIDTHFHTAQQFLRGKLFEIQVKRGLREPIWKHYLMKFESLLSEDDVYLSALAAYANMLKVGTTCFADAGGPHPEMMARAMEAIGIRGILARSTVDTDDQVPETMRMTTDEAIRANAELVSKWNNANGGLIRAWFALRQILVCSERLYKEIALLAEEYNTRIHTHLAEGTYEVDYCIEKWGRRPAQHLEDIGFMSPRVHAAHSALLSESEVDIYARHDVSSAHCPWGNFAHFGAPRVTEMRRRGIRVGIGSDGAAFGSVDLFKEMYASHACQMSHFGAPYHDFQAVSFTDVLRMATIESARALAWDDKIGSIEVGKDADIILINANDVDLLPVYEPRFTCAKIAVGANVDTVIVRGRIVMRGRRLQTIDEDELKVRIKKQVPRIMEQFIKHQA